VVARAVADAGAELEALEVSTVGKRQVVKVVVDRDTGINLDDVAEVSRQVSAALDEAADALGSAYTLEVTSPGVDRPLTRARHWARAKARLVEARLADGTTVAGRVGNAGDAEVDLLVDGTVRQLRYADVTHATVQIEFKQPSADELALLQIEEESR
jgi:ribosome maturation factor RimP